MDHSTLMPLPDAILQRILRMLPFSCMLRVKVVCKRWNTILSSPIFLRSMPSMPMSSCPLFFIFTPLQSTPSQLQCSGYDPLSETWHSFRIPSTPANCNSIDSVDELDRFIIYKYTRSNHSLTMCNPIAESPWIVLPLPSPKITFPFSNERHPDLCKTNSICIATSSTTLAFIQCVSVFLHDPMLTIDIYESNPDSYSKAWRAQQILRVSRSEPLYNTIMCISGVICNGVFYFALRAEQRDYNILCMAYHLSSNSLAPVMIPMPCSFSGISLINSRQRLMMAGIILKSDDGNTVESIGIWQLELNELGIAVEWGWVDTMSQQNLTRLNASRTIICYGCGDLIYFTRFEESSVQLIIFNVLQRTWNWSTPYQGTEAHTYYSGILRPRL